MSMKEGRKDGCCTSVHQLWVLDNWRIFTHIPPIGDLVSSISFPIICFLGMAHGLCISFFGSISILFPILFLQSWFYLTSWEKTRNCLQLPESLLSNADHRLEFPFRSNQDCRKPAFTSYPPLPPTSFPWTAVPFKGTATGWIDWCCLEFGSSFYSSSSYYYF